MEDIKSKVYIKVDEQNNVVSVEGGYSVSNITDFSKWILVDEGTGDRYNLCQNNYLSKPILEEHGLYQYAYIDGQIVEKDLSAELARLAHSKEEQYRLLVVQYIRERYSADDETAILRKRLAGLDVEEFGEYNYYCEQCKQRAKQELGI